MRNRKLVAILIALLVVVALLVVACGGEPTVPPPGSVTVPAPAATEAPTAAPSSAITVPNMDVFVTSGHADTKAEAFNHWNTANPAEVPADCAKCHTSAGFQEFASTGKVANNVKAPAGTFECKTCHNDAAEALTSVTFPSGKVVTTTEEGEAICMSCHQGRESKVSVDKQINETFKVTDVDAVVEPIKDDKGNTVNFGFRNVHYFAAGATLYGSQVGS